MCSYDTYTDQPKTIQINRCHKQKPKSEVPNSSKLHQIISTKCMSWFSWHTSSNLQTAVVEQHLWGVLACVCQISAAIPIFRWLFCPIWQTRDCEQAPNLNSKLDCIHAYIQAYKLPTNLSHGFILTKRQLQYCYNSEFTSASCWGVLKLSFLKLKFAILILYPEA